MKILSAIRRRLWQNRLTAGAVAAARPFYRSIRTRWMRWRFPSGGFVVGNGVRVFCDFANPNYAWYDADAPHLEFDKRIIQSLLAQSAGSVLIDVGAHFGFYSAVFAEIVSRRGGKLIAVEPDPDSFRCLKRTVAQFDGVENVLLPYAVSDTDGELTMYRGSSGPCLHSYEEEGSAVVATVHAAKLDTIVADHVSESEKVAFIKVDVDGAEPLFLRGARATLARHEPVIHIEFSPANLRASGNDPHAFFADLCEGRNAYWLSYQRMQATPVTLADYDVIVAEVGEAVTDLILAPRSMRITI